MPVEGGESVVLRLVVELQLAVFVVEVIGRALVPDHPVRVVRIHRLPAHRVDRHGAALFTVPKTQTDMKASHRVGALPWRCSPESLGRLPEPPPRVYMPMQLSQARASDTDAGRGHRGWRHGSKPR